MGSLSITLGGLTLFSVPLRRPLRIGRAPASDIVLPLPDIADLHAEVSPRDHQVIIRCVGDEVLRWKGRWVPEAELSSGEQIELGGYRLTWFGEPGEASASHKPTADLGDVELPAPSIEGERPTMLTCIAGVDIGREWPLEGHPRTLGRDPDCDIVLQDAAVSWHHLTLEPTADGVMIRDLGSRHGTYLDGRRVESAVGHVASDLRLAGTILRLASPLERASAACADDSRGLAELIGGSPPMQAVYGRIREAVASRVPVLLLGETGTGKELAARALHTLGGRSAAPFVPVNCAAIPRDMMEDELFGHARGAFTGAATDRAGAFETAHQGTLFLDEIGEMAAPLQAKLLRVLDDGIVYRLGGGTFESDFRLLAATNRDLGEEVSGGRFRPDLYYRLAVFPIKIPPLRERKEDIPDLLAAFLEAAEQSTGVSSAAATRFADDAVALLESHDWPGNVRELRSLVLQASIRRPGAVVETDLVRDILGSAPTGSVPPGSPANRTLAEIERDAIINTLRDSDGRKRETARRLGIAESTLYEKIRRHGIRS